MATCSEIHLLDRSRTAARIRQVVLWDAVAAMRQRFAIPDRQAGRLALTLDGRAAAVGDGGKVRLIELASGKLLLELAAEKMPVESLAVAPDGGTLLVGRFDGRLALWELASGKVIFRLPRHKRTVAAVAFAPDGRLSASAEGRPETDYTYLAKSPITIHLCDVATGEEVERFQGLTARVVSLAFSPDGKRLASALTDGTVVVWDVEPAMRKLATRWREPSPAELAGLWNDLAAEPAKGHRALWRLASFPGSAAFLKERLRPVPPPNSSRIRQLLLDLNCNRFTTRQKAAQELERLGERAVPALRRLLDGGPTLELRRRVEALLASAGVVRSAETLRVLRAIRVLEHTGSQQARDILTLLSKGYPAARATREAMAALKRLATRTVPEDAGRRTAGRIQ